MPSTPTNTLDAARLGRRLAKAYAAAVVAFLRSNDPQAIDYDPDTQDFVTGPVEDGTSPTDVGCWVAEHWLDLVGKLSSAASSSAADFDAGALSAEIAERMAGDERVHHIALSIAADRIAGEMRDLEALDVPRVH